MSTPTILFACIHNSGQSVAAEVLARHYGGDTVEVRSAGSEPSANVNPMVAQVLAELGHPVRDHTPTKLDGDLAQESDVVITMGIAARPARSSPAHATRTGPWTTQTGKTSRPSAGLWTLASGRRVTDESVRFSVETRT